jgi:diketogulonate reductase-like aldo/keto reductase
LQQGCAVIPKSVDKDRIAEFSPAQLLSWQLQDADMVALDSLEDGAKFCWDPKDVE